MNPILLIFKIVKSTTIFLLIISSIDLVNIIISRGVATYGNTMYRLYSMAFVVNFLLLFFLILYFSLKNYLLFSIENKQIKFIRLFFKGVIASLIIGVIFASAFFYVCSGESCAGAFIFPIIVMAGGFIFSLITTSIIYFIKGRNYFNYFESNKDSFQKINRKILFVVAIMLFVVAISLLDSDVISGGFVNYIFNFIFQ